MHVRTDRYGNTSLHIHTDEVAHSPETKIANVLRTHGIANRVFTLRVRDLLVQNPGLTIEQACAYVVHKANA